MKYSRSHRRRSRRALLQALYQWDFQHISEEDVHRFMTEEGALQKSDKAFFSQCLQQITSNTQKLDQSFSLHLDRPLEELTRIELACLRAGTYELLEREDIPPVVVINEWVELAKIFGAQDSYRYVNAVLDAVCRTIREENHERE